MVQKTRGNTVIKEISIKYNGRTTTAYHGGQGEPILFLHGFPDIKDSYRHQLEFFTKEGYEVLAPMLPGYEASSKNESTLYYLAELAETVMSWQQNLGFEKIHYVGHDWGAMIGQAAAAGFAQNFASFTSLAVPHLKNLPSGLAETPTQIFKSWYIAFFQLPALPEMVSGLLNQNLIRLLWSNWSPGYTPEKHELQKVLDQLAKRDVMKHALGYYRAFLPSHLPLFRQSLDLMLSKIDVPSLFMAGEKDGCLDIHLFNQMRGDDFTRGHRFVKLADCGHFLHQEKPAEVNALILEHIRANPIN